jgi:hypothetical protein
MLNDCDFYYIENAGIFGLTWGEVMDQMTWRIHDSFSKLTDEILDIPTYIRNGWCEEK